jgi:hypothetical protein
MLAVVYDGIVLLAAVQFADYPLERPFARADDRKPDRSRASRTLSPLRRVDALLGYTGAVFRAIRGRHVRSRCGRRSRSSPGLLLPALIGARLFPS